MFDVINWTSSISFLPELAVQVCHTDSQDLSLGELVDYEAQADGVRFSFAFLLDSVELEN